MKQNGDPVESRDIRWECSNCRALLGFIDKEQKSEVRIKRQDLYLNVRGGIIQIVCYKCGKINLLVDEEYQKFLKEKGGASNV